MAMKKFGLRQSMLSLAVFVALLAVLISVDQRVQERLSNLVLGNSMTSLGHRFGELASALVLALRHQSIDNAPLVVFAVVGAVLFVFMVKT